MTVFFRLIVLFQIFPEFCCWMNHHFLFASLAMAGPRDVESLRTFAIEEAEKAATKAAEGELDDDKEL